MKPLGFGLLASPEAGREKNERGMRKRRLPQRLSEGKPERCKSSRGHASRPGLKENQEAQRGDAGFMSASR
jgi:hypothetical protein